MSKHTEKLIDLIEPILQANYEWEKAVNDLTFEKAGMCSIISTPDFNKKMYADAFMNLSEKQYVFIKDLIRITKNYVLIEDMKANGTFDQEVEKDAEKFIEENKQI